MTIQEFSQITYLLKITYPRDNFIQDDNAMMVWYDLLKDLDAAAVKSAIVEWISTQQWPPTIADIRKGVVIKTQGHVPDWGDAWGSVLRAIRKYGQYETEKAMASFDEITRECVRNLGGFEALCVSENIESDRANFRMIYETKKARADRDAQVPDSVKLTQKTMGLLE